MTDKDGATLGMLIAGIFCFMFAFSHLTASEHVDGNLVGLFSEVSPWLGAHFTDVRRAAGLVVIIGLVVLLINLRFITRAPRHSGPKSLLSVALPLGQLILAIATIVSASWLCVISLLG